MFTDIKLSISLVRAPKVALEVPDSGTYQGVGISSPCTAGIPANPNTTARIRPFPRHLNFGYDVFIRTLTLLCIKLLLLPCSGKEYLILGPG
jgi:hypothetical protein